MSRTLVVWLVLSHPRFIRWLTSSPATGDFSLPSQVALTCERSLAFLPLLSQPLSSAILLQSLLVSTISHCICAK